MLLALSVLLAGRVLDVSLIETTVAAWRLVRDRPPPLVIPLVKNPQILQNAPNAAL